MDGEAMEAMKIYQRKHGGTLVEISILFVNVVDALKEAAQQGMEPTMLDDGQIYKMPKLKVIARGRIVWDDPHSK